MKDAKLAIRINSDLRSALDAEVKRSGLTLTSLVEIGLTDHLKRLASADETTQILAHIDQAEGRIQKQISQLESA
ncbi:MAG: hypothetical protein Q8O25_08240 [Sulfurisoma sp.]|nr:hypothetical protein [Sulfurisoma sp.]